MEKCDHGRMCVQCPNKMLNVFWKLKETFLILIHGWQKNEQEEN